MASTSNFFGFHEKLLLSAAGAAIICYASLRKPSADLSYVSCLERTISVVCITIEVLFSSDTRHRTEAEQPVFSTSALNVTPLHLRQMRYAGSPEGRYHATQEGISFIDGVCTGAMCLVN